MDRAKREIVRANSSVRRLAVLLVSLTMAAGLIDGSAHAQVPPEHSRSAVYISMGDGISWGFGVRDRSRQSAEALFARYLSDRLHRDVEWLSLADTSMVTTDSFLHGTHPQVAALGTALETYWRAGRPVVAITVSVGGNDLVAMGSACHSPPCTDLYSQALARMTPQLDDIYGDINSLKGPSTPLLVLTYYNASDCGQPGADNSPTELGVRGWNSAIGAAANRAGAFLVDGYSPFRGRACQLTGGMDLNEQGHAVMEKQYEKAYSALPSSYVEPFVLSEPSLLPPFAFLAAAAVAIVALVAIGRAGTGRIKA